VPLAVFIVAAVADCGFDTAPMAASDQSLVDSHITWTTHQ
jgi:hypothetical protein